MVQPEKPLETWTDIELMTWVFDLEILQISNCLLFFKAHLTLFSIKNPNVPPILWTRIFCPLLCFSWHVSDLFFQSLQLCIRFGPGLCTSSRTNHWNRGCSPRKLNITAEDVTKQPNGKPKSQPNLFICTTRGYQPAAWICIGDWWQFGTGVFWILPAYDNKKKRFLTYRSWSTLPQDTKPQTISALWSCPWWRI